MSVAASVGGEERNNCSTGRGVSQLSSSIHLMASVEGFCLVTVAGCGGPRQQIAQTEHHCSVAPKQSTRQRQQPGYCQPQSVSWCTALQRNSHNIHIAPVQTQMAYCSCSNTVHGYPCRFWLSGFKRCESLTWLTKAVDKDSWSGCREVPLAAGSWCYAISNSSVTAVAVFWRCWLPPRSLSAPNAKHSTWPPS